jgi:hypothetical protein
LDATFTERDYGAGSFLEFIRKLEKDNLVQARKTDRGYLVEMIEGEGPKEPLPEVVEPASEAVAEPAQPAELAPSPEPAPEPGLSAVETFALLKKALSTLTEKAPSRPIYLRQVRQAMRSADGRFDERQGGFRGLLDLLHQAQREGWLRLHRDRKGIWRVFPISTEAVPAPAAPEAVPEAFPETFPETFPEPVAAPEAESAPETDVLWETLESPEEPTLLEAPPVEPPASEPPAEPVQAAPEKRARKAHAAKRSPKRPPRKQASRRKPKETTEP